MYKGEFFVSRFQEKLKPHVPAILKELETHALISLPDLINILKDKGIASTMDSSEFLFGLRGLIELGLLPKEKIAKPTLPSHFNKAQEEVFREILNKAISENKRYSIIELAELCHEKCPNQSIKSFEAKIRFLLVPLAISGAEDETSGFP